MTYVFTFSTKFCESNYPQLNTYVYIKLDNWNLHKSKILSVITMKLTITLWIFIILSIEFVSASYIRVSKKIKITVFSSLSTYLINYLF